MEYALLNVTSEVLRTETDETGSIIESVVSGKIVYDNWQPMCI